MTKNQLKLFSILDPYVDKELKFGCWVKLIFGHKVPPSYVFVVGKRNYRIKLHNPISNECESHPLDRDEIMQTNVLDTKKEILGQIGHNTIEQYIENNSNYKDISYFNKDGWRYAWESSDFQEGIHPLGKHKIKKLFRIDKQVMDYTEEELEDLLSFLNKLDEPN